LFGKKIIDEWEYYYLKSVLLDFNNKLLREKQQLQQNYSHACKNQEEINWQQELRRRELREGNLKESENIVEEQRKKITELYKEIDFLQGTVKKIKKKKISRRNQN